MPKKADYLIFDTTGIEPYVTENNPKFLNTKLKEAKKLSKAYPEYNPYTGVYSMLPETANANPSARQQYINGHYCYAHKVGIMTNGIGIIRDIAFFDDDFRKSHPDVVSKKSGNPDLDKEISDSHFDKTPFSFLGKSGGENRSLRFKWVCSKSIPCGSTRICTCETPCTASSYGKCTYTDVYLAAITQVIGVILAKSLHELKLFKSVRKLIKKVS